MSENRANVTDWLTDKWANIEKDVGSGVIPPLEEGRKLEAPISASIDEEIADGKKRTETHYDKNGVILKKVFYDIDGKTVARERVYTDGEVTSWNEIQYDGHGNIELELNVVDGEYHGLQTEYVDGILQTTIEYDKGKAKGEWIEYDIEGNIRNVTILAGDGKGAGGINIGGGTTARMSSDYQDKIFGVTEGKRRGAKGTQISSHSYWPDGELRNSKTFDKHGNEVTVIYTKDGQVRKRTVFAPDGSVIERYRNEELGRNLLKNK